MLAYNTSILSTVYQAAKAQRDHAIHHNTQTDTDSLDSTLLKYRMHYADVAHPFETGCNTQQTPIWISGQDMRLRCYVVGCCPRYRAMHSCSHEWTNANTEDP